MRIYVASDDHKHVIELAQVNGHWLPAGCVNRDWESRIRQPVPLEVAVADARSHVDPAEGRRR